MSVNLVSALEAVLFVGGEPMSMDKLCQIFDITPEELNVLAESLEKKLSDSDSGVKLVTLDNAYQLITKTEYADYIKKAFEIKRKTPLSQAGFEVLAVVAYNQPVTRAFIEQVRGVDCSGAIYTLMERGLVEERGRLDLPVNPCFTEPPKTF